MKHIVFDLGRVLIEWDPELAFTHRFPSAQAVRDWMTRVGFSDWNAHQDAGRSFADGLAQARADLGDAEAAPLGDYLDRFPLTIARAVPGTWEIADVLKARGHRMFAITNWGRETWPAATAQYPRLEEVFEDIVISGVERLVKPQPEIFHLLLNRNDITAGDCIFIDDSAANVAAARGIGMDAIRFTDAGALTAELAERTLA